MKEVTLTVDGVETVFDTVTISVEETSTETPPDAPDDPVEPVDPVDPDPSEPVDPPEELDDRPQSILRDLNTQRMLNFNTWNSNSRYERFDKHVTWKDDLVYVGFKCQELGGGGRIALQGSNYTLLIDGIVHTSVDVSPGDTGATFVVDATVLEDGWHVLDLIPAGEETAVPFPVFVFRGTELPEQTWMPVWTGSKGHFGRYRLHWVNAEAEGSPMPLPPREFPNFGNVPSESNLNFETLTGTMSGHPRSRFITEDGVFTTATRQWYTWDDLVRTTPRLPLKDGPRGQNTLGYPTHIEVGIGRFDDEPTSPAMNALYVTDPWRLCRVMPDGSVTTLVGYRHNGVPDQWEDPQNLELVGDWSDIPEERHGFHEIWGMCWFPETLKIDNDAERIPEEFNRKPHFRAPVAFLADSQNDRIVRVEFNATAHGIPPKVTEFVRKPGAGCWDCVAWGNKLIVSERELHQIVQYDMETGEQERVILQGADKGRVDWNRFVYRTDSLDSVRDEDCVLPEGLDIVDDWLYYGSAVMGAVRRVHLVTGEVQGLRGKSYTSTKADNYWKIAVSDGTAGAKGTIYVTNWKVSEFGGPKFWEPNPGVDFDSPGLYSGQSSQRLFTYNATNLHRGKGGGGFRSLGYSAAVAARNGRIVFGTSFDGLMSVSRALSTDETVNRTKYNSGRLTYNRAGYHLKFGEHAQNRFGEELPWGEDADMDYFLEICGAERPAQDE